MRAKMLQRHLLWSLVLLFLICIPSANASLIDAVLGGHIVTYDGGGTAVFTSAGGGGGGTIVFSAEDTKINYDGGGSEFLIDQNSTSSGAVDFVLSVTVDSTGAVTGGSMTETVKSGAELILSNAPGGPFTYSANEVLLTGLVTGFELETGSGKLDFGASININAAGSKWASGATSIGWITAFDTITRGDFQLQFGAVSSTWWNGGDFSGDTLEGKKGATPEPSSLILFGVAGLFMLGCVWRRRKQVS